MCVGDDAAAGHVERAGAAEADVEDAATGPRATTHRGRADATGVVAEVAGCIGDAAADHGQRAGAAVADVEIAAIGPRTARHRGRADAANFGAEIAGRVGRVSASNHFKRGGASCSDVETIAEIRAGADRCRAAIENRVGVDSPCGQSHGKQPGEHKAECPRGFRDGAITGGERDRSSESHKTFQHERGIGLEKPVPLSTHGECVAGDCVGRLRPGREACQKESHDRGRNRGENTRRDIKPARKRCATIRRETARLGFSLFESQFPRGAAVQIAIIAGSHRKDSQSSRVGAYIAKDLARIDSSATVDTIDLAGNPLPLWVSRTCSCSRAPRKSAISRL